eukprot:jgi/Ulvmu1/167/UM001_0171.1
MLTSRLRHAHAGMPYHLVLIPLAIFFLTSMTLLWQRLWSGTAGLHQPTSTSIIRTAQLDRVGHALELENDSLKQQVTDLTQQLLHLEHKALPKVHASHQNLSVPTNRHALWMPSEQRDRDSSNPELAAILRRISIKDEVAVAVSNRHLAADGFMLEAWCKGMQRAGVTNHLVVALDDVTQTQVEKFGSTAVRVNLAGDEEQKALQTGSSHAVSGLKFQILKEFLLLGYSVLLSDVDIVTVSNPFEHLQRDSDVEGMSDGWDAAKAYGYNDVFDDPQMGWSRYSHSIRVSVINSGLFFMRPTLASMDVLNLVFDRIKAEHGWDQALFNEVLFLPSRPGYTSPHATRRILDRHLFMNSKTLFVYLRKDAQLYADVKPVMVHVNYHNDKWRRFTAVEQRYVYGVATALDGLPDGST